jgi:hypothetical protein
MPLSDHEQRILADIEARLRADDPRFADTVGTTTVSKHLRSRLRLAGLAFFVGFVLLFVGLQVHILWGVLGFGLMLGSAYYALTAARQLTRTRPAREAETARGPLQRYLDTARRRDDDES